MISLATPCEPKTDDRQHQDRNEAAFAADIEDIGVVSAGRDAVERFPLSAIGEQASN